jgi:hypothetical protein
VQFNQTTGEAQAVIVDGPPVIMNQQLEGENTVDDYAPTSYQARAIELVHAYVQSRLEKTDTHVSFGISDVYVVWFCKTLNNWKALLSTTLPDGMYYEVTHDGVACYDYIDAYKKFENVGVPEGVSPAEFLR